MSLNEKSMKTSSDRLLVDPTGAIGISVGSGTDGNSNNSLTSSFNS